MDISATLIATAFVGGLLMFLAPCTFPLIPAFLASLVPRQNVQGNNILITQRAKEYVIPVFLFTAGFTFIFVLYGSLAGYIGSEIIKYKIVLSQIGGIFVVFFGLSVLRVFDIPILHKTFNAHSRVHIAKSSYRAPLFLGVFFGFGWVPCAGPILASILLLASESTTAFQGGFLLLVFSLGLAIPFIIVGTLYAHSLRIITLYTRFISVITLLSGLFLVVLGFFLIFGQFLLTTQWGFVVYSFFGYTPMCTYI